MDNTGERHFIYQLLKGYPHALRTKADMLRRVANAKHGYAFAGNKGVLPQCLQGIAPSVMLGYHTQAGGTAVHRVELAVVGEI